MTPDLDYRANCPRHNGQGTAADLAQSNRASAVHLVPTQQAEVAVILDQLQRYVTAGVVVTNDAVGQLAGFGEHATGKLRGRMRRCRCWVEQHHGRRIGHPFRLRHQDSSFELFFFGDGVRAF